MCYVIVTFRTLLWCICTIVSTVAMVACILSPSWLIGPSRPHGYKGKITSLLSMDPNGSNSNYYPTLGLHNHCRQINNVGESYTDACASFVTSFTMPSDRFPDCWKAALVFFGFGIILMTFTVGTSLIGCCKRSINRKSIFTVSGTIQAFAALLYILALMLYPAGWGSQRVKMVCGDLADPYSIGVCSLGWAFYVCIGAIISTFVCAALSVQAEISTSSDEVQDEILEGKNLICLL